MSMVTPRLPKERSESCPERLEDPDVGMNHVESGWVSADELPSTMRCLKGLQGSRQKHEFVRGRG